MDEKSTEKNPESAEDPTITLTCCKRKKCPTVTFHENGSVTLADRDGPPA